MSEFLICLKNRADSLGLSFLHSPTFGSNKPQEEEEEGNLQARYSCNLEGSLYLLVDIAYGVPGLDFRGIEAAMKDFIRTHAFGSRAGDTRVQMVATNHPVRDFWVGSSSASGGRSSNNPFSYSPGLSLLQAQPNNLNSALVPIIEMLYPDVRLEVASVPKQGLDGYESLKTTLYNIWRGLYPHEHRRRQPRAEQPPALSITQVLELPLQEVWPGFALSFYNINQENNHRRILAVNGMSWPQFIEELDEIQADRTISVTIVTGRDEDEFEVLRIVKRVLEDYDMLIGTLQSTYWNMYDGAEDLMQLLHANIWPGYQLEFLHISCTNQRVPLNINDQSWEDFILLLNKVEARRTE